MIISAVLILVTLAATIVWIVNILWGRRHLYAAARKAKGPPSVPFFGVSLDFVRNPFDFLRILHGYFDQTPGLFMMWFGNQQIWGINRPDYAEIVMNSPNCYGKMMYMYESLAYFAGQGLISGPVSVWKRHRKIINPAFNQRVLNGFMEVFVDNCSILMEKLKLFDGKGEFDMHEAIYKCNLDIVCESMMGVKVHAQTTNSTYHRVFERLLDIALLRMANISYRLEFYFRKTKIYAENVELKRVLIDFTNKVIRKKQEEYENKKKQTNAPIEVQSGDYIKCKAFSDLLIEETTFTEDEIKDEIITFIMAGSDTSTAATGFTLLMLAMHPEVQNKVLEEILTVVGPDRNIECDDLSHLKYLECCVKESLRLFPPVSFILRQVEGDVKLDDDMTLPRGSNVLFGVMALHRSATYWPDPLRFDPDRFQPENVAKRHQYAFIPFSGGPRNCIGYRFALMSIKNMVATVIRQYKINTSYKSVGDIGMRANIVLKTQDGVKISLQHR